MIIDADRILGRVIGEEEKLMGITEKIAHAKKTKWVTEGLSDYEIKIIVESAKKSAQDSKSKFSIEKRDIDSKRC